MRLYWNTVTADFKAPPMTRYLAIVRRIPPDVFLGTLAQGIDQSQRSLCFTATVMDVIENWFDHPDYPERRDAKLSEDQVCRLVFGGVRNANMIFQSYLTEYEGELVDAYREHALGFHRFERAVVRRLSELVR